MQFEYESVTVGKSGRPASGVSEGACQSALMKAGPIHLVWGRTTDHGQSPAYGTVSAHAGVDFLIDASFHAGTDVSIIAEVVGDRRVFIAVVLLLVSLTAL